MRVGLITHFDNARLEWMHRHGFASFAWQQFHEHPACTEADWKHHADSVASAAESHGFRISTIGAFYRNALDPRQSETAIRIFKRAVDVASHLHINTVSGFPGAVIETKLNERGGNPVYVPFENFMPQFLAFWKPLAQYAAERGVRFAFEHCPMGTYHLPIMGFNFLAKPAMWERLFNEPGCENLGIEWDAAHLIGQFIDPIENIHTFGKRIFHVHAKDAYVNKRLLEKYGICHYGVVEHRMVGFGQSNWAEIVHALLRAGYDSDLNVEGRHDPIYRDHEAAQPEDVLWEGHDPQAGRKWENAGLLVAKRTLERYTRDLGN
jgi:sugar phosphate isomerase/epimerase